MRLIRLAAPALALTMMGTAGIVSAQGYGRPDQQGYGAPREGYGQGGWDVPPQEMREVERQGFRDGIMGARRDIENHRRPDVNNRDEFRHPNVPRNVRRDYKMGFRRGYETAMAHELRGRDEYRPR